MQTKEIRGTIERGTIIVGINTAESGCYDAKAIMDYYMQEKNKYQVFAYLQLSNNDELYTIFDSIIDCHYSRLENWFKQSLKRSIDSGNLRKTFIKYSKKLSNGFKLQHYDIGRSFLMNSTESGHSIEVNWQNLNKVFNNCKDNRVNRISLSTSIYIRCSGMEGSVEMSLIGSTVGVITLIKYLETDSEHYYECEVTYDELVTSIKLLLNENHKQFVVNISIKHNNRILERELEQFIISKASRVTFLNRENEVHTPIVQMSFRDSLKLDNKLSLSSGSTVTQFSDFYWRSNGMNKQSSLF